MGMTMGSSRFVATETCFRIIHRPSDPKNPLCITVSALNRLNCEFTARRPVAEPLKFCRCVAYELAGAAIEFKFGLPGHG